MEALYCGGAFSAPRLQQPRRMPGRVGPAGLLSEAILRPSGKFRCGGRPPGYRLRVGQVSPHERPQTATFAAPRQGATMSDEAGLLRAILDHPNDDIHRLVFADWLEENGDPRRAHFIRSQLELAKKPTCDPLYLRCWNE